MSGLYMYLLQNMYSVESYMCALYTIKYDADEQCVCVCVCVCVSVLGFLPNSLLPFICQECKTAEINKVPHCCE